MNTSRYKKRRELLINLYSKFRNVDIEKANRAMRLFYRLDCWEWKKPVVINGRIVVGA